MKKEEYLRLKEQAEAKRLRLQEQAEAEYRKRLEAIELVWRFSQEVDGVPEDSSPVVTEKPNRLPSPSKGRVVNAVREATSRIQGTFSIRNVLENLPAKQTLKKGSVKAALHRLVDSGCLEVVQQGSGRSPTIFRRKA